MHSRAVSGHVFVDTDPQYSNDGGKYPYRNQRCADAAVISSVYSRIWQDEQGRRESELRKKLKILLILLLIVLLYEIVGACIPFIHTKKVKKAYSEKLNTESFTQVSSGSDWAQIAETNEEALDVRLAMFEEAEESIVISTFDIRPGKSTSDIFASLLAAADRG